MDDRDWVYNGTRFVSQSSSDAADVMTFESCGVAEGIANHLRNRSVATGITAKRASWNIVKNARFPPIAGQMPPTPKELHAAKARAEIQSAKERVKRGRPNDALMLNP